MKLEELRKRAERGELVPQWFVGVDFGTKSSSVVVMVIPRKSTSAKPMEIFTKALDRFVEAFSTGMKMLEEGVRKYVEAIKAILESVPIAPPVVKEPPEWPRPALQTAPPRSYTTGVPRRAWGRREVRRRRRSADPLLQVRAWISV